MKLLVILLFSGLVTACRGDLPPTLLLVSFDGFRADYLKNYEFPHLQNFIKEDRTVVYDKMKSCHPHMNVYLKEDIPNRFYYQHNDRIQPIILVADEGWTIVLNKSSQKLGDHGYDNSLQSMHPFLAAHGPAFHKGYKQSTMNIVDIYPMMCHILGLKPHPNNGTFSHTKCLLVDQWCINLPEAIGIVIGALMVLTMLTCLIIIMQNRLSAPRPFSRLQLQDDDDDPLIE
ncbi:bis(5'-adenosyl)-triphosphatase ENPP4 isoform X2 [Nycticebus coucang]|uniref:bis(5'-adenosyl)-triphosphatase ENPP4 isoform X2 n=1 Tax=Nycticebus coucang TaxID=9470 RepID=UPI00234CDDC0|nr:bis(5'-adenosyl)-triphosphatase ENPP4 isoform X2 [Nycticebus coucang]